MCAGLFYDPGYGSGLPWQMSHVHFNRMCLLLLWDGVLYKHQLCPVVEELRFSISLLTYSLLIFLSVAERQVLESLTTIVYFSFQFNQFLPHIFYRTIIRFIYIFDVMCSWWVETFHDHAVSPISLVIFLVLNSFLSDINVAISAFDYF